MGIADELITRGWNRGSVEADDKSVCLIGAVRAALGLPLLAGHYDWSLPDEVREAIWSCDGIRDHHVNGHPCIWSWNDQKGRTFDEVLRVAKEADEILDGL